MVLWAMYFQNQVKAFRMSRPWSTGTVGIGCLILNFIGVLLLISIIKLSSAIQPVASSGDGTTVAPVQQSTPKLDIRIANKDYLSGYLQIDGIFTNSCKVPVFSSATYSAIYASAQQVNYATSCFKICSFVKPGIRPQLFPAISFHVQYPPGITHSSSFVRFSISARIFNSITRAFCGEASL